MKINIPDDLWRQIKDSIGELPDENADLIETRIIDFLYLNSFRINSKVQDIDKLTECKNYFCFISDLNRETWGETGSKYRQRFFCLNIENFKKFLDTSSIPEGDEVLRTIAANLLSLYGFDDVYRYGGDKFLVRLNNRKPQNIDIHKDIKMNYAILNIALLKSQARNHRINKTIEMQILKCFIEGDSNFKEFRYEGYNEEKD